MLTPDMSTKDRNTQDLLDPISGNILSFDFGEKRIGVAIGNNITKTSHPLSTIDTPVNTKRFLAIEKLISQWSPILIVIGFPLNEDWTSSRLTALVKKFASKIKNKFGIKISLIDERLTSIEAEILLKETDANVKKRKSVIDQVAAQIILTSYFEGAEHVVT